MRVLLGSGGFRTPERVALLCTTMRSFFGAMDRLLFLPYALHDHDGYVQALLERGLNAGYTLEGIHRFPNPQRAIAQASAIYVGGGNTFRLLDTLYRLDLLDAIRDRVQQGTPYLGISAGSNVACPTIKTTNDMPIVQPASFNALGLVPFQINPHYFDGQIHVRAGEELVPHFGETREERIREFHEMNPTPVVGLWEAGLLRIEGAEVHLLGAAARLFRRGEAPQELSPGSRLDFLLQAR